MLPDESATAPISDSPLLAAFAAVRDERLDDAILAAERAIALDPASGLYALALAASALGTPGHAVTLLEQAHARDPEAREIADALAALHARIGHVNESLYYAKLATTLASNETLAAAPHEALGTFFGNLERGQVDFHLARARKQLHLGNLTEATAEAAAQLELTPGDPDSLRFLAMASLAQGAIERSLAAWQALLHTPNATADDRSRFAVALAESGRFEAAEAVHHAAMELAPNDAEIEARHVFHHATDPDHHSPEIANAGKFWRKTHANPVLADAARSEPAKTPDGPLRVGYLCGSLLDPDSAQLLEILLEGQRRRGEQIVCYVENLSTGGAAERMARLAWRWTDLAGIDDETACAILRGDRLDAVIDLAGFAPGGRPLLLARRPAPLVFALGGATAAFELAGLDGLLVDAANTLVARKHVAVICAERELVAWRPPALVPDPVARPSDGPLTLGVACNFAMLSPSHVSTLAARLSATRSARLLLMNSRRQDAAAANRPLELFAHHGLGERVDVVDAEANRFATGFEFYQHVDLALLLPSESGHVSTCRALWMGVPAVALTTGHEPSRARSALSAASHADWICIEGSTFANTVDALAADRARLAALRSGMREKLKGSRLLDVAGLAAAIGDLIPARARKPARKRTNAVA